MNGTMRYLSALLSLGTAALLYGILKLVLHRRKLRDVPKPPCSLFWGHLKLFAEVSALYPPNMHPQVVFTYMKQKYDLPEIFYVDLWPLGPVFMICTSIDALNLVETRLGLGQHVANQKSMDPLVGKDSIPSLNGRVWKEVHNMLLPAFRPQAIRKLMGKVAEEAGVFRDKLAPLADRGEAFGMVELASRMVFEVNAKTIVGLPLNAQEGGCQVHSDLKMPLEIWRDENGCWNSVRKSKLKSIRIDALARSGNWLRETVLERYRELKAENVKVSDNILDNCVIERIQAEADGLGGLEQDQAWLDLLVNNLRALLVGAQGTTNDTLVFIIMLLSAHPSCLQALREEHNRIAGHTFAAATDLLTNQPQRTSELEYTTGVIKETLRLFPVGFGVKHNDKTPDGHIELNGVRYPTLGRDSMIAVASHAMHHDPAIFPEPAKFNPARWAAPSAAMQKAWHPFSGGAHRCLGRELAMDELRGYLLGLVRWFDFEIVDLKPRTTPRVPWNDLDLKLGDLAFQELQLGACPRGNVMMRARRTERAWYMAYLWRLSELHPSSVYPNPEFCLSALARAIVQNKILSPLWREYYALPHYTSGGLRSLFAQSFRPTPAH
ncbi:hypothetical protein N0V93_001261 [Gnomoniopsis smithogilvyi]|uniref:Cytochrome P450 n=1 Tax=Gnomoniopsis smithogilvyi TaxID=1191159 RepID=A0A9W9D115_9PEZI|nr:hypothetical protein N0V93_001261 [Gnomoniopsis smithogilvyi]